MFELDFYLDGRIRSVTQGDPSAEVAGLNETMDNNPIVCADQVSVPDPLSTLALIALVPIIRAGLLSQSPAIMSSISAVATLTNRFLALEGWDAGASYAHEDLDFGGAAAVSVLAPIHNPPSFDELDGLFEESYGRSFFVRAAMPTGLDPKTVVGTPCADYELRLTPGETESLLTIRVVADLNGKCGASQIVHAMNIMIGCEESLGILDG